MTFNWCHGPRCHKRSTTTRVRGVKGSKVLRTKKVPYSSNCGRYFKPYLYFCDQTCMHDYVVAHIEEIVQLHPRTEPLETPIDVRVEDRQDYFGRPYKQKVIVDRTTDEVRQRIIVDRPT